MSITFSKIGFIGASKMGTVLARYFQSKGLALSGFYSANRTALKETQALINGEPFLNIHSLVEASDVIFITTKDTDIAHQWSSIQTKISTEKKYFYHCSGVLSSAVFNAPTAGIGSMHPMASFHDKNMPLDIMNSLTFAIEGNITGLEKLHNLLMFTNNPSVILNKDKKIEYHIACVAMSNFLISLVSFAQKLFKDCLENSADSTTVLNAWLLNGEKIIHTIKQGVEIKDVLTGPLIRKDVNTLKKHMQQFTHNKKNNPMDKILYQALSYNLLNQFIPESADRKTLLNILEISEETCQLNTLR